MLRQQAEQREAARLAAKERYAKRKAAKERATANRKSILKEASVKSDLLPDLQNVDPFEVSEVLAIPYEKTIVDGKCKVLLGVNYLPDRHWLSLIANKEGQASTEFYMPGMNTAGESYYTSKAMGKSQMCFYRTQHLESDVTFQIHGKIIRVIAGDLLTVKFDGEEFTVRLWGVTAPSHLETFIDESRRHLAELCLGKEVVVYCRHQNGNRQFVGVVKLNGKNINDCMIRDGYAQADRKEGLININKALEKEAIESSNGLWAKGWTEDEKPAK